MLAKTLHEAVGTLHPDARRALQGGVRDFYVDRKSGVWQRMFMALQNSDDQRCKILFGGHRGSGKSAELLKLRHELRHSERLRKNYAPIPISISGELEERNFHHVDLLWMMTSKLFLAADNKPVEVPAATNNLFQDFANLVLSETGKIEQTTKGAAGAEAKTPSLLGLVESFNASLRIELTTRETLRKLMVPRVSALVSLMDDVGRAFRSKKIEPVIFVEDLDKVDTATAKSFFVDYGKTFFSPKIDIVYTFPVELQADESFQVLMSSVEVEIMPIFKIVERNGDTHEMNRALFEKVVMNRLEENLLEPEALKHLVSMSGGVPQDLVSMLRTACNYAGARLLDATDVPEQVTLKDAEDAVTERRQSYQVMLHGDHYRILRELLDTQGNKPELNAETAKLFNELLRNKSILEYRNRDIWYVPHPIVRDILSSPTNF